MALPSSRQDREYQKFVENAAGSVAIRVVATDASGSDIALVDDAAFTPGTSPLMPIGFIADETATDSVNEGDIGTPRMTLDRRLITANLFLEDTAHVSGDYGAGVLAVRNDTLGSLVGTNGDYAPLQLTALGELSTHDATLAAATAVPTVITSGNKTIAATGTAEALGASLATKSVYVRAKGANTGNVYVGDSTVDVVTNQGIILAANDSVTLNIANRATIYVDVDVNGEGVDYVALS